MTILKPYGGLFIALHRVLDACLITLTLWGANRALEHDWAPTLTLALAGAIVLFLALGEARRLYASWRLGSLDDEFGNVLAIWILTCSALIVVAFLLKQGL